MLISRSMLSVGLTGNIATGKSCVSLKFAELGAHVIDADHIVHELLSRGTKTYEKIIESFGAEVLSEDGSIDRRALGEIVFSCADKRLLLNDLTHPEVGARIIGKITELEARDTKGVVIVEAALIVETGSHERYDRLIVVTCNSDCQISRLIERDCLSREEAEARIRSQMPIEEKLKFADYRIDTSGTLAQTHDQVEAIYRDLLVQEIHER